MLVYAREQATGERERAATVFAGDGRVSAFARGFEEEFDLGAQRLNVNDVEIPDLHAGPRTRRARRREPDDRCASRSVVNGAVVLRLEEAHLANLLRADARGRDVRDRAGRKFDARVRGVHAVRQDWQADGANVRHLGLAADEPEDYVEVVDHQVEHHVNVERARGELADAVNLEIDGVADVRAERDERGVEAFEVSDHQRRLAALGGGGHRVGLIYRARDRFFDEDVDARFEQRAGDLGVRLGRRGEADGVNVADERAPVGRPFRPALFGDRARGLFVRVADRDEARLTFGGERGVDARVLATEAADADDRRAKFQRG